MWIFAIFVHLSIRLNNRLTLYQSINQLIINNLLTCFVSLCLWLHKQLDIQRKQLGKTPGNNKLKLSQNRLQVFSCPAGCDILTKLWFTLASTISTEKLNVYPIIKETQKPLRETCAGGLQYFSNMVYFLLHIRFMTVNSKFNEFLDLLGIEPDSLCGLVSKKYLLIYCWCVNWTRDDTAGFTKGDGW